MPNAENARIDEPKFTRYFFGGSNPYGLSKRIAFNSHLGYNISNWKDFETEILEKVNLNPSKFDLQTEYGEYYDLAMIVYSKKNNPMDIMTTWEVKEGITRLVTAYSNSKKG